MDSIRDVMTIHPLVTVSKDTCIVDAARRMKNDDIGDVLVLDGDTLCGILTDRDIVIRAVADGLDPQAALIGDLCTKDLVTVGPDEDLDRAVELMRDHAIRRLPVVEDGKPIGILSLGDLAIERSPNSLLGELSQAAPQH